MHYIRIYSDKLYNKKGIKKNRKEGKEDKSKRKHSECGTCDGKLKGISKARQLITEIAENPFPSTPLSIFKEFYFTSELSLVLYSQNLRRNVGISSYRISN